MKKIHASGTLTCVTAYVNMKLHPLKEVTNETVRLRNKTSFLFCLFLFGFVWFYYYYFLFNKKVVQD